VSGDGGQDGLPRGEGAFLACTFWLEDNYSLQSRHDEAVEVLERPLSLRNDLGLLAEEYDVAEGRLVGSLPQAFSHVPLVDTAGNLSRDGGPSHPRADDARDRSPRSTPLPQSRRNALSTGATALALTMWV
jgi:hypothetical protein